MFKRNTTIFIPSATVKIGDETYTANAAGQIQIRQGVSVSGTVEATDYNDGSFEFEAITDDTVNTVYLDPQAVVTFTVKDEKNNLLSGAVVTVGGKQATTNSSGVCTISLKQGIHSYTAKYQNYQGKGDITVGLSNMSASIAVTLDISTMKPEENGNIQLMLIGTAATLDVTSTTTDYVISWGDGTTENASGVGSKTYNHTYPDAGYYQVELSNCEEVTLCNGSPTCLIAYWSIGDSKISGLEFDTFKKLEYIGDLWINDINRTSLSRFCQYCDRLKFIDLSSFANNHSVTTLSNFLSGCSGLTTIDLTPLAGMTKVTSLYEFLSHCQGLTNIDLTPLAGMTEVVRLTYFLFNCQGLTNIDLTPLAGMTKVIKLDAFLHTCSGLTSIDLIPLASMTEVENLDAFMKLCSGLTSIDLTPLAGMTKVTSLYDFICACGKLVSIIIGWTTPPPASSGTLNSTGSGPIYTPDESVDLYKTATNWSKYATRYQPISNKPAI